MSVSLLRLPGLLRLLMLLCLHPGSQSRIKDSSEVWDEEVAEWWGEWSSWSTCSRTCGGGVMSRERHCLRQRLQTVLGTDNTVCGGHSKQYQLCQKELCPTGSVSFKQYQCSAFNAKAFGKIYHHWVPLYPDDYTSISSKPCDLQCTSTSRERQLLVPAHDGTSCRDRTYQGVCISGKCEPVGCDGKLYSAQSLDRCGICGGDGSTCYRVSGNFRKCVLGYALITTIPAGAFDILITEKRNTENILALADSAGNFFINGNMMMDNPQNFRVAGTLVKYRRPPNVQSEGLEYLTAPGPTNQSLSVMYYNFNGKIPHIAYEYTVPRAPEPPLPLLSGPREQSLNTPSSVHSQSLGGSEGNLQDPSDTWSWLNPEEGKSLHQHSERPDKEQDGREEQTEDMLASTEPPQGMLQSDLWRLCDQQSDSTLCQTLFAGSHPLPDPALDKKQLRGSLILPAAYEHLGSSLVTQPLQAPSSNSDLVAGQDISRADMYRWKVSAYSPCSSTCSSGISSTYALCIRYDGREVDESHCDPTTRPEPTQEFCSGRECMPRWESSGWSECSRSCGQGIQVRSVRCWKMLAPGLDSSVYDEQCDGAQLPRPPQRKVCKNKPCGPQWELSEWSECLASCGSEGAMRREVRCSSDLHQCDESIKPQAEKPCQGPPCDHHWTSSEWGPCSKTCGSGLQVREVKCYQGEEVGHGCDPATKPESKQSCQLQPCPTEAPDENCEDKATANCSLVLKVKLCSHWYYRKACCRACGGKSP
ncbi:ADAMTS-like protein 2 isoform X3 [Xenopus tropicalis]|uniref:ADAMTS-like protein 2 isoform X3 n=1 Tax=Xenopus tropicalis TaxID=8364 RepID=A0A8J1JIK3_XENTR|nr:ADAMTS-like protein 2 isoform X3 [Xenopus tropicalis]